jgi:hypothetical protein
MTLTQHDLDAIGQLFDIKIDNALEAKLTEKLRDYPTRQEFLSHMDQIMTELKAIRQEQEFQTYRLRDHEDRITVLEDTVKPSKTQK